MIQDAQDTLDRARAEDREAEKLIHGIRTSYHRGCRCLPCRAANASYERDRTRREPTLVDASDARAHLQMLGQHKVGYKQAGQLSGLSWVMLARIRSGQQRRIRQATAEAILAIQPVKARGRWVNSYRTRHLLMCLLGEGFTPADLAARLGISVGWLTRDGLSTRKGRSHVSVKRADRVKRFHRHITLE